MNANSLMNDIAYWFLFVSLSWIGFLGLVAITIVFLQLIKALIEDLKNDD